MATVADNIANREVESLADVIDAEYKEFFRERLIENREAKLGLLNRMRTRKAVVTEVVPPAAKPLHNRSGSRGSLFRGRRAGS